MIKEDYDFEKQEDEDLRCPICNYYFSSMTKPYLLPCNHNLCIKCIDNIIEKKMLYCPMCRKPFSLEERKNFKVNFPFLNLVIKILKTKIIYCSKCSKIYHWTEHSKICDQSQFKETNEIFDELKLLAKDCVKTMKDLYECENLKEENLNKIYEQINSNENFIEKTFFERGKKILENFFQNIPVLNNSDEIYNEIFNFLKVCEPIFNILNLNINLKEINNEQNHNFNLKDSIENFIKNKPKKEVDVTLEEGNNLIHNCIAGGKIISDIDSVINNNIDKNINNDENNLKFYKKGSSDSSNNYMTPGGDVENNLENDKISIMSQPNINIGNGNINIDKINEIISQISKISDKVNQILNYTRQVEFTSETIKSQITQNYTKYNKKITSDLNSIYDNISLNQNKEQYKYRYLINYIDDTKKIWIYDIYTNRCDIKNFDFLPYNFNNTSSIDYDEKTSLIYYCGGIFTESSLFSNKTIISEDLYIFPFSNGLSEMNNFISKYKIPHKRYGHSSLYFNNKLFLIGGKNEKKIFLKECECYNIKDKIWELMPNLNYNRIKPTLCLFNEKYLYCFRGPDEESNSYIEMLDIYNINTGWNLIKFEDPGHCFTSCIFSGSCVLDNSRIIICGGYEINKSYKEEKEYKTMIGYTYIYNVVTRTIYRGKDLLKPAIFSKCGIKNLDKNRVVIIDDENITKKNFGVHSYHLDQNKWTFN